MNGKFISFLLCCLIWESSAIPTNLLLSYQDSFGQYSFGYSAPGSARSEVKTLNGATHGAYSYIDENGVIQSTQYIADDDGFHVVATNLPQAPLPVEETAEVLAARKAHLEALQLAERMAEEAGNEQEPSVLSKESVDQSDRSENEMTVTGEENREGSKVMGESMPKNDALSGNDQTSVSQKAEATTSKEANENISNILLIKERLSLPNVPVFRITYGNQQSETNMAIEQGEPIDPENDELTLNIEDKESFSEEKSQGNKNSLMDVSPLKCPYMSLIKFLPPGAIHYISYQRGDRSTQ